MFGTVARSDSAAGRRLRVHRFPPAVAQCTVPLPARAPLPFGRAARGAPARRGELLSVDVRRPRTRTATRHRRPWRPLLLVIGAATVVSLLAADPAAVGLLLDADFLTLSAAVGLAFLGQDVRLWARRAAVTLPVLWCRVGVRLTREQPGSLLA